MSVSACLSLTLSGTRARQYVLKDGKSTRITDQNKNLVATVGVKQIEDWLTDSAHEIALTGDISPKEEGEDAGYYQILNHPAYPKSMTIVLEPGCHVIAGPSAVGKTTLLSQIDRELGEIDKATIIFMEPEINAITIEAELYDLLASHFAVQRSVILLDSLRHFVYSSSSTATGKGGTNMALFSKLTALDVIARNLDVALVATVNVLSADEEAFTLLENSLVGSVATAILLPNPGSIRLSSRSLDNRAILRGSWKRHDGEFTVSQKVSYDQNDYIYGIRS